MSPAPVCWKAALSIAASEAEWYEYEAAGSASTAPAARKVSPAQSRCSDAVSSWACSNLKALATSAACAKPSAANRRAVAKAASRSGAAAMPRTMVFRSSACLLRSWMRVFKAVVRLWSAAAS